MGSGSPRRNPLALAIGAAFLGACVWLIHDGHSWEGVILGVAFMIASMVRGKGA